MGLRLRRLRRGVQMRDDSACGWAALTSKRIGALVYVCSRSRSTPRR